MRRFLLPVALLVALAWAVPVSADQMGDNVTFRVNSTYDADHAQHISATLRALGSRVYLYVDDRYWSQLDAAARLEYAGDLQDLVSEFDETIHPYSTSFWGHENDPGVDGDPHITLLLERLIPGNGGYFETINSYPKNQAPESNAREMFVVAADTVGGQRVLDFAAHEFQHVISFNQKTLKQNVSDDVWLNELRSEYNITVVGYSTPFNGSSLQRRIQSFLRTPSDSLTEWPNSATDYGTASIFGHYLHDRYGGAVLQHTIHSRQAGVRAIDEWFAQSSKPERFRDVFADWMSAVIVNDLRDPRYGYVSTGLNTMRVVPSHIDRLEGLARTRWSLELKEWQPDWIRMDMPSGTPPSPTLTVQVAGQPGDDWGGTYVADYSGTVQVVPWRASLGKATIGIPTNSGGSTLRSVTFAIAQGTDESTEDRTMEPQPVTVSATLDPSAAQTTPGATPTPTAPSGALKDGDLINHNGAKEVYVIWGKYRRYLVPGILELYGFQNRPVIPVNDDVFNRYTTSNYIRVVNTEPVYAVWPDGTKHHFAITAAQWDAAGRDWNSIFIVNEAEGAFYGTGSSITR